MSPNDIDSIVAPPPGRAEKIADGVAGYRATFTTVEVFRRPDGAAQLIVRIGREESVLELGPEAARHLADRLTRALPIVPEEVQ